MSDKSYEGFGYQKTDIGLLPVEWVVVPIGKVITLSQYGLSVAVDEKGTVPILGMKDLSNGRVRLDELARVSINQKEIEQFCLKPGDILLNRTNSYDLVGKVGLYKSNQTVVFASYLVRFQFDTTRALPEFINYVLNSHSAQQGLKRLATKGVSQANINPTVFRNQFLVPLPPLREQKRIVDILQTWDEAIAKTEKIITAKQKLKSKFLNHLLTGDFRFSKFKFDKWNMVSLKSCTVFVRDGTHGTHKRIDDINSVPLLSAINIGKDGEIFLDETSTRISEYDYKKIHSKYELQENDLLITVVGTLGRRALISQNTPKITFQRSVGIFRFKESILPTFVYHYTGTIFFQKEMRKRANITAQAGVYIGELEKLEIPLISIVEQEKIANLLDDFDREIKTIKQLCRSYQKQKRGLMQKLLTGKWRVNVEEAACSLNSMI